MKLYIEPEIYLILVDSNDLLTASGPEDDAFGTDIFGFFLS